MSFVVFPVRVKIYRWNRFHFWAEYVERKYLQRPQHLISSFHLFHLSSLLLFSLFHLKFSLTVFEMPLHRCGFTPSRSKKRKRDSESIQNLKQLAREKNLYLRIKGNLSLNYIIVE